MPSDLPCRSACRPVFSVSPSMAADITRHSPGLGIVPQHMGMDLLYKAASFRCSQTRLPWDFSRNRS
jgi:hypothetical protein